MGGHQPVLSPGSPLRAAKFCGCIPRTNLDLRERQGPARGHLARKGGRGQDSHGKPLRAASLLLPHRDRAEPPCAAHKGTSCGQRSRLSVLIIYLNRYSRHPGGAIFMQTPGKGQEPQHPSSVHPSLPDPPEGAACRAGTVLLTHRTLSFFPFLPSCQELPGLRGRSAGGRPWLRCLPRAGKAPRASSATTKHLPGLRARPLPSLPGGGGRAGTKAPVRCHSWSLCSATAAAGRAAPKTQPVVSPRGADTPRRRSRCDTAHVKWHRRVPPAPQGNSRAGLGCGETATSSCQHHHRAANRGKTRWG